jgi:hypothetical protein
MNCGIREMARKARLRKKRIEANRKQQASEAAKIKAQIAAMTYLCGGHTQAELIEVRAEVELIVDDRKHRWGYVKTCTVRRNDGE